MRAAFFSIFYLLIGLVAEAVPKFHTADDSIPLIRRDLLPLDRAAMDHLANQLTTLADTEVTQKAPALRQRAQLLTLILRLSPSQNRARQMQRDLSERTFRPSPNNSDLASALKEAFATASWLTTLPPETQGSRLAQLLLDVLSPFRKDHPLMAKHQLAGLNDRWQGLIPPLTAFKDKDAPKTPLPTPGTPENLVAKTPENPEKTPKYHTTALLTTIPMVTVSESRLSLGTVDTSLILTPTSDGSAGSIKFKPGPSSGAREQDFIQKLLVFFESKGRPLPKNYNLFINTGKESYAKKNQDNLLAPLAILLDSAITGRDLEPNVILFAKLEDDGSLTRPAQSWPLLHSLREKRTPPGTRLLVPSSLKEELTAMLVIEEPGFLLRFEIIACDNYTQARNLFLGKNEQPPEIQQSSKTFQEVAEVLTRKSDANIPSSLVFPSVGSRLREAAGTSPRHLSANVLLRQASGNRPSRFSTPMFARELLRLTPSLTRTPEVDFSNGSKKLKEFHARQRQILEDFRDSRQVDRDDRAFIEDGIDLVDRIRSIARLFLTGKSTAGTLALKNWKEQAQLFRKKIERLTGDPAH